MSLEVPGGHWRSLKVTGGPSTPLEVPRDPWKSLEIIGDLWRSLEVLGGPWRLMLMCSDGFHLDGSDRWWKTSIGVEVDFICPFFWIKIHLVIV